MKTLRIVILLLMLSASMQAMIYSDSRILSLSEMNELGIQIESAELPGPSHLRRIAVTVSVFPVAKGNRFVSTSYSILEKAPDADFASSDGRKSGVRDSKRWAKEIRGETSQKPIFTFNVAPDELPYGYLVVHLTLPRKDGIGVFGLYYFLLRDLKRERR
jgi:hypothetical protein